MATKPIVIDIGTGFVKAGFAGDKTPSAVFQTVVAQDEQGSYFVGSQVQGTDRLLNLRYPVKKGVVCNWDDLEKILQFTFTQLNVDPTDRTILLAMSFSTSEEDRAKLSNMMFKKFKIAAIFVAINNVLTLYSTGKLDGVVLEIGAGTSDCVPIKDGYAVRKAVGMPNVPLKSFGEQEIKAIAQTIHDCIRNGKHGCDFEAKLYANVCLSGGNASYPGLSGQVQYELQKLAGDQTAVKVSSVSTGNSSAWIGGSILAALDQMKKKYLNKADFEKDPNATQKDKPEDEIAEDPNAGQNANAGQESTVKSRPIVIDIGTAFMKVGFAGEHDPGLHFSTVIAEDSEGNAVIGNDVQGKDGLRQVRYPVKNGTIQNLDDMGKILRHAFSELSISPSRHMFVIGQAVNVPIEQKEKLAAMMFKDFNCRGIFFVVNNVLSLYATGNQTGLVTELGAGVSSCLPIYQGYAVPNTTVVCDVTVTQITEAEVKNIARAIFDSLEKVRKEKGDEVVALIYPTIFLAGGIASSPNLDGLVLAELKKLLPNKPVKVQVAPKHGVTSWIGGSILGALEQAKSFFITNEEYQKDASVIRKKTV